MSMKNRLEQNILDYADYQKNHEFFAVTPQVVVSQKPSTDRLNNWLTMCQKANLELSDYFLSGKKDSVLIFKNGFQITDSGSRVSFSTVKDKKDLDINSAKTIVRCSANHLYRQGWNQGIDISTIRQGSGEMITSFEDAYADANKMDQQQIIASLQRKNNLNK